MRHATPLLTFDSELLLRRTLESIPGLLVWGTLVGLTVLAFTQPLLVAVFLIFYDFYWLVRALHVATNLIASYRTLRRMRGTDWIARLQLLDDPRRALEVVDARIRDVERQVAETSGSERQRSGKTLRQELLFRNDLLRLRRPDDQWPTDVPRWTDILHVVILPTYKEPLLLLTQSLDALAAAIYPKERLWVIVALEERAGEHAAVVQRALEARYKNTFGRFLTTVHPDGIPGERQVKSANASYAARVVQQLLDAGGIPYEQVLISNFDADTVPSPEYFGVLTYTYLVTADRLRCSYQPLPLYHNNIWEAPAFTRVISTNSTFWILIQFARSERMVTYSSHAMPFRALVDAGFWDPTVVSEDSRIFWQAYVHYQGAYRTVPMDATVSMDVTCAPTLVQTFINQYKQKRRWAWGIENFPFIAKAFLQRSAIPVRERFLRAGAMLEAWHSWATAALILAFLGWIPVLFGNVEFQRTVLAFNLPRVTRTLLTIGMVGLILNATLSLLLLPPAPPGTPRRRYLWMVFQWVLTPIITSVLGALPAVDAQTRLLLGTYLGFWVTPKVRVEPMRVRAPLLTTAVSRR
ncbi:MAG: hypothetical protein G01um101438_180 [Parcubacteria group bacterium Gr01-1014_38]|nr:MAG: hypothetical protein G01um101438_180 [Parcubacteria group bacterium Gr01-1014_38]